MTIWFYCDVISSRPLSFQTKEPPDARVGAGRSVSLAEQRKSP